MSHASLCISDHHALMNFLASKYYIRARWILFISNYNNYSIVYYLSSKSQ